jgi:hypothetical protein
MITLDSINVYAKYLPFYLSYGEYEDTIPSIAVGSPLTLEGFLPIEDFLPFRPIKQNIATTQICDTADNYWISDEIVNIISKRFFEIPAVEYIFLSMENDSIDIRTVINKYDKEIAKNIYTAEYDLLETFKDYFFDFLIIYREDREINDICPSESVIIFRV